MRAFFGYLRTLTAYFAVDKQHNQRADDRDDKATEGLC